MVVAPPEALLLREQVAFAISRSRERTMRPLARSINAPAVICGLSSGDLWVIWGIVLVN